MFHFQNFKFMSKIKSGDLSMFSFYRMGYGCYHVIYTTPLRGDYFSSFIQDMTLIDSTLNSDVAKIKDIKNLIRAIKLLGIHHSKNHDIIN